MGIFTLVGLIVGIIFVLSGGFSKSVTETYSEPARSRDKKQRAEKKKQGASKEPFLNQGASLSFKSRKVREAAVCWTTGQPKSECQCSSCKKI